MRSWLKQRLPEPALERLRVWRAASRNAREWRDYQRRPTIPPPHVVKVRTVLDHAARFGTRTLVETGTFEGEMARQCAGAFARVITIELDPGYAARARRRLARQANVTVLEGDSARRLPEVLAALREPALFWLDGHWSGGATARGDKDTPLLEELDAIARHGMPGHVILVDDARCLGSGDYPGAAEVEERLRRVPGVTHVAIAEDIVRATPAPPPRS